MKTPKTRKCKWCGDEFTPANRQQFKYCKLRCGYSARSAAYRLRNRQKCNQDSSKWYHRNRDKAKESKIRFNVINPGYQRQWYFANRDKCIEARKRWRERNPIAYRALLCRAAQRRSERRLALSLQRGIHEITKLIKGDRECQPN